MNEASRGLGELDRDHKDSPEDKNNNIVSNIISDRAFPNIPNELSYLILSHLNQQNRIKLSRVSKAFRNLTHASIFWHEAIIYNTRGFEDNALQILKNVLYLDARASKLNDEFVRKLILGPPGKSLRGNAAFPSVLCLKILQKLIFINLFIYLFIYSFIP